MIRAIPIGSFAFAGALLVSGGPTGSTETSGTPLWIGALAAQEAGDADEPWDDVDSGYERPKELSERNARRASGLQVEIQELRGAGQYDKALQCAKKLLRIREGSQPYWITPGGRMEWWETADARRLVESLERTGELSDEDAARLAEADQADVTVASLLAQNRHQEARELLVRQLATRQQLLGREQLDVTLCIRRLGLVHSRLLERVSAESRYREALELRRRILGKHHPLVAESLFDLAQMFVPLRSREAIPLVREAWETRVRLFGEDDPSSVGYLTHYGCALLSGGDPRAAERVLLRARSQRQAVSGQDTLHEVGILIHLAASQGAGALERADEFLGEALDIVSRNPSWRTSAHALHPREVLSGIRLRRGDVAGAKECLREAIQLGREGSARYWLAKCLMGLGSIQWGEHDYLDAEHGFREAVELMRACAGDHPETQGGHLWLGRLLLVLGDYVEAEALCRESVEMVPALGDAWRHRLPGALDGLGDALFARGDNGGAEEQYLRSFQLRRKRLGDWHAEVASSQIALSRVYAALGNIAEAESRCQWALTILGGASGSRDARMALAKTAMGEIREARGEPVSAEARFREVLAIRRELRDPPHPEIASALCSLARTRYRRGDFRRAEEGFSEALDMQRELFGSVHPDIARSLDGLAGALYGLGELETAEEIQREALGMMELLRPQVLGEEVERARYAHRLGLPACTADYVRLMVDRGRWRYALEAFERGRARAILDLLARGEEDVVENARRSADPETRARLEEALAAEEEARGKILVAESRLAEMHGRTDLEGSEKNQGILKAVEALKEARREEGQAFAKVMEELWTLYPQGSPASASQIRNMLRQDELLLGYAWTDEMLLLLLVPPGSGGGSISGHVLAEGREAMERLAGLAGRVRASMSDPAAALATRGSRGERLERGKVLDRGAIDASAELFRAVIPEEVWEEVRSKGRIVVLPDGPLNAIPFEALAVEAGPNWQLSTTFLDAGPEVVYGASASVLIDRAEARRGQLVRGSGRISALVVADPELRPKRSGRRRPDDATGPQGAGEGAAEESAGECRSLFDETFPDLPGARAEGTRIVQAFRRVGGREATLLRDRDATLSNLLEELPGKRFLHLATHGLTGSASRPYDACLALSPPDRLTPDDVGFLRLEDLVRSWRSRLEDCELVVLSACETGSGEQIGDSYLALPIGFFYAGAPAVIASLWKVDDKCTADLMGSFYERALDDRQGDKLTLFTEARRELRQEQVHPFYWAPFIYHGDPR